MTKEQKTILIAALLASGLFLLVFGLGLGFLFMFLPTLPLLSAGLSSNNGHPNIVLKAAILATIIITGMAGISVSMMWFTLFALPSWYLCRMAALSRDIYFGDAATPLRFWFPVGIILLHLALYGCALLALATGAFALTDATLPAALAGNITKEIATMEKEFGMTIDVAANQLTYMICGFLVWMWSVCLWLHAILANRALHKKNLARRTSLGVTPFPVPNWLLTLMGICALASFIGGESVSFLGKSCLIILLMPYAFLGASLVHAFTLTWPNRKFFLGFMYFCIITQFWPAFILSGLGLWHHLKILNKHWPK